MEVNRSEMLPLGPTVKFTADFEIVSYTLRFVLDL